MMGEFRKTSVSVGSKAVIVEASSYEFVPAFLWYMFEAKGIPQGLPILFFDGMFRFSEDHQALVETNKEKEGLAW